MEELDSKSIADLKADALEIFAELRRRGAVRILEDLSTELDNEVHYAKSLKG